MNKRRRTFALGAVALAAVVASVAQVGQAATPADDGPGGETITASRVAQVVPPDPPGAFGPVTVLEGPAFGADGRLYFVHLTAPAGQPKILALDVRTGHVAPIWTDATSGLSSLQFSPVDGRMYVTDFTGGKIDRLDPDGTGFTTVFSGPVDGRPLVPDDIAFDKSGAMFVADYQGSPWNPIGRVVRLDPDGTHPTVVQDGLAAPNGISFSPDFSALWVSEYSLGREDRFTLAPDHRSVVDAHAGMTANIGVNGFDSNTVDAAGNVYQVVMGGGKVLVWNPAGDLLATIVVPQQPQPEPLVSNLAIKMGTTDGYLTVGGPNGGYIYRFRALAPGIPQSNGGA